MAETASSKEIYWLEPKYRGVFFFDKIKIPKKVKKILRKNPFKIAIDKNFEAVIEGCSKITAHRKDTWINNTIKDIYSDMFYKGYAHSVECYLDNRLVGGLYGLSIGSIFFGESMFSTVTNASKVALFHLIERLIVGDYSFLDTQFINDHLKQYGAEEITNSAFKKILGTAIEKEAIFERFSPSGDIPMNIYPLKNNII